jgi:D-glycero-D-manno-heptose 1,7-bisphosphate phosphatase
MPHPGVFMDRDGTLIHDPGHLTEPEKVELLPGAAAAVRRLNGAGLPVIVVTNQSVIARGLAPASKVEGGNARMLELLAAEGASVVAVYYCPHHPDFSGPCECRKPLPGMLVRGAREHGIDLKRSYMIGDSPTDIEAGAAAGARTILVPENGGAKAHHGEFKVPPDSIAGSVLEAVDLVLDDLGKTPICGAPWD